MRDRMIRAMPPHKNPNSSWLTATEVKLAPSRASNPSAAEVNMRRPNTTRVKNTSKNGVSIDLPFIPLEIGNASHFRSYFDNGHNHTVVISNGTSNHNKAMV